MMNNDVSRAPSDQEKSAQQKNIWKKALGMLVHNWGWKIGSLVLAVCLWGALISQDTSLPRDKTITGVRVTASNAATLRNNGLIVVSGLEDLGTVDLRVRLPQRSYTSAAAANYTARLDLSQIQEAGEQTIKVTASATNSTNYGTVLEVMDGEVTVTVEEAMSLSNIPVEVRREGALPEGYYAGVLSRMVEYVDVSGPKSVVEKVTRCVVVYDQSTLSPLRNPNTASLPFTLEDFDGNSLDLTNLTVTARGQTAAIQRIGVTQEVYYMARVQVDTDTLVTGTPAEGYAVSNVRVVPDTITIAGSQEALAPYLDNILKLYPYDQVDISGQSRNVSQLLYLNTPGNVEYISNNAVQVVVTILPEEFVNMAGIGTETTEQQNP